MNLSSKILGLFVLLSAFGMKAQVSTMIGGQAAGQQASNTLLLGSGTAVTYDSNALTSQPPVANAQYMIYPQIGLNWSRPRWHALINVVPGLSYSSANLPQYQGLSLTSSVEIQYSASPRLTLNLRNNLISSTNPFNSLTVGTQASAASGTPEISSALNYLPRTNEIVSAEVTYNLSARTSLTALGFYNYLSYQDDPNIASAAQVFQQSNSAHVTLGAHRRSSHKYQGGVEYSAQILDAGPGEIKTLSQSVLYRARYEPTSRLRVSATIGPEFVSNTFAGNLGGGRADVVPRGTSGWTWTGSAAVTWNLGDNQFAVTAAKLLSPGTQYQGNVDETLLNAEVRRRLGRIDLTLFGSYSINNPVFVFQSAPRLSNNYVSTGAVISKTIARFWNVNVGYWYLLQNAPQYSGQVFYGNHNRVIFSLSYSIIKPLHK